MYKFSERPISYNMRGINHDHRRGQTADNRLRDRHADRQTERQCESNISSPKFRLQEYNFFFKNYHIMQDSIFIRKRSKLVSARSADRVPVVLQSEYLNKSWLEKSNSIRLSLHDILDCLNPAQMNTVERKIFKKYINCTHFPQQLPSLGGGGGGMNLEWYMYSCKLNKFCMYFHNILQTH